MASKNKYQDLFRARVCSAINQAKAAAGLSHQGVKGSILEILVGQLFEPLLPADIGIGTGQIIDSYSGQQSGQLDIILYNKAILPPLLIDQKLGVFPIESVLYAIEVKTTLNATELRKAHESAKILQTKFGYLPGFKDQNGNHKHHSIERLRYVVFALNTDLSENGLSEAERYRRLYGDDSAYIRAICVAGKEYWYDNGNFWLGFNYEDEYDDVLCFIGGVTNTYRSLSESRGYPLLGNYIIPAIKSQIGSKARDVISIHVKCNNCGLEGEMTPDVGDMNITVKGKVRAEESCSSCGGDMESDSATYTFENGKLTILSHFN
ncbi:DUF6602 domain-containing protein [Thiothrix sp.]|jgi:hypothetical protein|uniref:DUF6602 domain-containing protein n=1 Tax=Thiothrix sp. TaxID=1032 RepID=UPI0025807D4C|nr:DUF6602 domain-containing protein [Thiothrix sp.]